MKKLKNGKQPGPDRMKAEIYRWMTDSEICLRSAKKMRKQMVVTAIDFAKAFDSVNRKI